ncbi:lef6 [Peridroma alphabaculovirus]|uniref:Lef6 n=1 Tax=Peridroma alphabaculovirus TaxID=1346829 RepID=A0A068LL29_9ABAC|nr:lef6 [Peridroma alphabaculovirus]AIE47853.1 lef6 [Peridroma alphabaculovirus]
MYVFRINGGRVEKRFGREFINYICGGKIKRDLKSNECTRKRIVVTTRYAADKLLAAHRRAVWPDGTTFECELQRRRRTSGCKPLASRSTRSPRRYKSPPAPATPPSSSPLPPLSPVISEDWYSSFMDISIHGDDDDDDAVADTALPLVETQC